jgi:hypothetical protein
LRASGETVRSGFRRASRASASISPETRGNTCESPMRESRGRSASVPKAARPCTTFPARHRTSWQFPPAPSPIPTFRRRVSRSGGRASTRGSRCRPALSITPQLPARPTFVIALGLRRTRGLTLHWVPRFARRRRCVAGAAAPRASLRQSGSAPCRVSSNSGARPIQDRAPGSASKRHTDVANA